MNPLRSEQPMPARIGPFEVRAFLGRGGMGEVWLGWDPMLTREVALKLLPEKHMLGADAEDRLIREARAASALDHPGIVKVHQLGREGDRLFVAMEYIAGRPLGAVLEEDGPQPPGRVVDIVRQVAAALGAAHRAGLVHRDIKPDNLMARDDGRVKILDFGLVHAVTEQSRPRWRVNPSSKDGTRDAPAQALDETLPAGSVAETQLVCAISDGASVTRAVGTPLYMAPEQAGGHEPTAAADQFSLAATAFELLTGRPLRRGDSLVEVLRAPIEPALEEPALTGQARAVLRRALAPSPELRFENVEAFSRALSEALEPRAPSAVRGRRVWIAAIGALAIAAPLGFFAWRRRASEPSVLVMAIVPGNRVLFAQLYTPVAEYLGDRIGKKIQIEVAKTYDDALDGLRDERFHLAFLPPKAYVDARRKLPDLVLLGGRDYPGEVGYRSVILTRTVGATPTLDIVRGKPFCFVDRESTSGYLVPRVMLRRAGIDPDKDVRTIFVGDHFKVLTRLRSGECEFGAVSSLQLADAPRQSLPTDDFVVLAQSEQLPPVAIVAHPSLTKRTLEALADAVKVASERTVIEQGADLAEGTGRFRAVSDKDYDVIREMDR